jgi:kinesin family member C2/C3
LVEELHLALEKMRGELEESRAEAARAVKVAEQAICSAELSSSKDWNSTVTHKAAEAAAAAQKKSAEAMAKARIAEEKLEIERKNAAIWKKQVEAAEEQAGHFQTRAAAAEVQRYAVAEALESERKKNAQLKAAMASSSKEEKQDAFDPFDSFNSGSSMPPPQEEIDRLRSKLAMESARRRKLLGELQDLRGAVRVYCKLTSTTNDPTIALVSNEVLLLRRDGPISVDAFNQDSIDESTPGGDAPLSFEFEGILPSDAEQEDIYAEFESVCSSVVEGFKICVMSYGAANSGKTHTMLGDIIYDKNHSASIQDHGVQLRSMKQLFSVLEHRRDRYQDSVTMTLIEVHDEKLVDLIAGTDYGDAHGRIEGARKSASRRRTESEDGKSRASVLSVGNASQQANSISSSRPKLEIKTNRDGETVVHGVLSVEVSSFQDVCRVWAESLSMRSKRLSEQDTDLRTYQLGSHVIATLKVVSRNIGNGVTTTGRIQFVDFAAADTVSRPSRTSSSVSPSHSDNLEKWKYVNKSLSTIDEVVRARSQYQHAVPYRNSTITHLIRDSLEADTKVIMIACVSSEENDIRNTTCTLRFAQEMRKVVVGKATRHTNVPSAK